MTPHACSIASRENAARRERARELADRLGTSASAIAVAYVLHQPEHVLPVVGTRSPEHLDEAFAAAALELTREELDWLEAGPVGQRELRTRSASSISSATTST